MAQHGGNMDINSSNNQGDATAQRPPASDKAIAAIALIILGFGGYKIIELFFRANNPCLSILSIDVLDGPLNVSYAKAPSMKAPSSTIAGSWNFSFAYSNQDHLKITYFGGINVSMYYEKVFLGNSFVGFQEVHQGKNQRWLSMSARIDARSVHLNDLLAYTLAQDINDHVIGYDVVVETNAFIKSKWWIGEKRRLAHRFHNTTYNRLDCTPNIHKLLW